MSLFESLLADLGQAPESAAAAPPRPKQSKSATPSNGNNLVKRKADEDLQGPKDKALKPTPTSSRKTSPAPGARPSNASNKATVNRTANFIDKKDVSSGSANYVKKESMRLETVKFSSSNKPAVTSSAPKPPAKNSFAELMARGKAIHEHDLANAKPSIFDRKVGEVLDEWEAQKAADKAKKREDLRLRRLSRSRSGSAEPGYGSASSAARRGRVEKSSVVGKGRVASALSASAAAADRKKAAAAAAKAAKKERDEEERKRARERLKPQSTYKGTANLHKPATSSSTASASNPRARPTVSKTLGRRMSSVSSHSASERSGYGESDDDDLSDMEAGLYDLDEEEEFALREARKEDARAQREEKEARRLKLEKLARERAAKDKARNRRPSAY